MKKMIYIIFENLCSMFIVLLVPALALASSEGQATHGVGLDEHTLKTIIYQAINVGALIIGLIYFLRTPIQTFFKNKKETYLAAAQKAQAVRQAAEAEKMQIEVRLNKLESTADESVSRAKAEATEMRNQLLLEAQNISKRLREEAHLAAKLEVEKAKNHLREQIISESMVLARTQLETVTSEEQQQLQGHFINNIQAVQR